MTEKQSITLWKEHVKLILSATSIDPAETDEAQRTRKARLEQDPEEWFAYYFPKYAYAQPAPFHVEATLRVICNPEHYEVRMWSRELAKSTRTMMEVLYLTLVGHPIPGGRQLKKYVLMVSNSLDNATRLLMPYKANLEHNQRIIKDYGAQENTGKWQAAEFTTEGGISFRAIGAGQSPRGTRNEEARPDILLFDDMDTDADCLNPELIRKKWKWIEEAAIGTRSVSAPTTVLFCGNRIARNCCVELATAFADHVDEINIRDAAGRSVWPQKNREQDIDRVLAQKSYAAAQKEYFNNPVVEGAVFREMAYKPALEPAAYQALVCYTDPSYTATGDYKATILAGLTGQEVHLLKCYVEQTTTATMLQWHFDLLDYLAGARCAFYMEQVFMQDVLLREMNEGMARTGRYLSLRADTRKKPDKYTRIESLLEPLHRMGRLYLNEAERHNPHMTRLEGQFKAFAPGSSAHDDGPDAVEGAVWLLLQQAEAYQPGSVVTARERRVACY